MHARRFFRLVTVGLSASLYFAAPPHGPYRLERGPLRPRAIVRPPRLESIPPPSAR